MSNKIDAQFNTALTSFTADTDNTPGVVDSQEARELIESARDINADNAWLCGLIPSSKGKDGLAKLYSGANGKFDPLAKAMVDEFVSNGRELDSKFTSQYTKFTSATDATPGVVDRNEAMQLVGTAASVNRANQSWFWGLFGYKSTVGTEELQTLLKNTNGAFSAEAKKVVNSFIKTGQAEKVITEFKTAKETWHCHWFPMKESKAGGGDRINNLFAPGGVLDKYDQVFGTESREYELANNFRAHDSEASDANWSGHCNNASEVAAMLERPKKSVTYQGVTFSPNDIAGLLVKVSGSLRGSVDFVGRRYNNEGDPKTDPAPEVFLNQVLRAWGTEAESAIPFVLDIDREAQVWNYPYDQGKITESAVAPEGVDVGDLPEGGQITFYTAELKGSTFDAQARTYQFWIQYADDGSVMKSAWIKGDDAKINPDFAWRPHPRGDLSDKANWVSSPHRQNNPHVDAADVYEIYSRSL